MLILCCVSLVLLTSSDVWENEPLNSVIGFSGARLCSALNSDLWSNSSFKFSEDLVVVCSSCLLKQGNGAQIANNSPFLITFILSLTLVTLTGIVLLERSTWEKATKKLKNIPPLIILLELGYSMITKRKPLFSLRISAIKVSDVKSITI